MVLPFFIHSYTCSMSDGIKRQQTNLYIICVCKTEWNGNVRNESFLILFI